MSFKVTASPSGTNLRTDLQALTHAVLPEPALSTESSLDFDVCAVSTMPICFALRLGGNAKEELDADDGSMDPMGRAKLEEQVAAARRIAATLAKYSPAKQVETGEPAWR